MGHFWATLYTVQQLLLRERERERERERGEGEGEGERKRHKSCCTHSTFALPELPGKHHMIGYRPMLTPGSERYVHHMMLYECHGGREDSYGLFNHHVNSGYECHAPNMPEDFKRCRGIVAAW